MDWLQYGVQWLHILLGIFWFGSGLTMNFVVIPALSKLPLERQREVVGPLGEQGNRILPIVAMGVIALGFLRGTVFGQIQSLDALGTTYGITWLVGLLAALGTFSWGKWMLEPALERVNAIPLADAIASDGRPTPALAAAIGHVKRVGMLELLGFLVILSCMVLMRFGY